MLGLVRGSQQDRLPRRGILRRWRRSIRKSKDPLANPCKLLAPFALAIDQQDRIWVTSGFGDFVTRFPASDPTKAETWSWRERALEKPHRFDVLALVARQASSLDPRGPITGFNNARSRGVRLRMGSPVNGQASAAGTR